MDTPAGVDAVVEAFAVDVGIERLRLVHVNDSRSALGSRSDRHEHIGAGRIGAAGLGRMATHPALGDVVYLLETPGMDEGYDAINVQRLHDAALGRPLADLPPEAFRTRSSKGRSAPPEEPPRTADGPPEDAPRRRSGARVIGAARVADPPDRRRTLELAVLIAILVLAALTRLPGIDARGQWDADQGTDMLVLRALVEDGELPLLGPRTSIGSFHHGAVYYWLLAPAAFLSGADPVAVTVEIALLGIGAVAAVWWLARLVGGPLAAAVAGLLAAVSPAGIDESTFIWNPNPIPLFAALAFVGVVLARRSGRARWWAARGRSARWARCSSTSWAW